jgi:hypothetical protein
VGKSEENVGKEERSHPHHFAWAVEVVGVVVGFVTAVVTTYPDGNLPTSLWPWLMVLPMGMIAVAELGRIPLISVLFHRHKVMQAIAFIGIVFLAGLAFENWMFGFERIVELRLKSVTAADLVLTKAEANLRDLESKHKNTTKGDTGRRAEFVAQLKDIQAQIDHENTNFRDNMVAISEACHKVREICVQPQQDKERARHAKVIEPLDKQANDLRTKISMLTDSDRKTGQKLEDEMAAASDEVSAAKKAKAEQIGQNQIFRLAAMWYRVSPADVTPEQFEFVRFWFSVFSAIAVALAGTVSALVYYAKQRIPGDSVWTRLLTKMLRARRAYYARKRKPIFRDVTVEVAKEKIVYQDREVPVEKIVYRDGKEPPTIVEKEKEVVKWIDRIVLIPRWGIKTPIHVNSLIRNKKSYDEPNVTEMRKIRDGRQD